MDPVKILGFGLSGLTFLLFLFSFRLISQEQKRAGQPRKGIIQLILVFMLLALISTIIVGWFGIVQNTNQKLINKNDSLYQKNLELFQIYTNYLNSQTKKQIDSLDVKNKTELEEMIETIKSNTDSLYQAIALVDPQKADSLSNKIKQMDSLVIAIRQTPATDTTKLKMLSEKIILNSKSFHISATTTELRRTP
jgi:hypothetical protein